MDLVIGQRISLESISILDYLRLKINLSFFKKLENIALNCIALDKNEKLINDKYIIYSENISSPEGAIKTNIIKKNLL